MRVDHAIVGAGLSGLLLAQALLDDAPGGTSRRSPSAGSRVLLVDPLPADDRPLTFAYWTHRPTPLDPWAIDAWSTLRLVDHDGCEQHVGLDGWRYSAVAWGHARADLLTRLAADSRVILLHEPVEAILDRPTEARVLTPSGEIRASWVYDSRPPTASDLVTDLGLTAPSPETPLLQVFRGIWVHTADPVIDTSAATLLDFSADRSPDLAFGYVLPTSMTSAMVMAVRMGREPREPDPRPYASRLAGASSWQAEAEEWGTTPLISRRPTRRRGRHVLVIGRRGGRVRPSTGYAVSRVLDDTDAIVGSLARHGDPFDIPPDPRWQQRLDTIWLRALTQQRAGLEPAFLALFARAGIESVLRFLDGEARPRDVAAVVRSLPPGPFVRAALGRSPE